MSKDPATADKFKHLLGKDGKWATCDDVWIRDLDRNGKLTGGQAYHWNTNAENYYLIGEADGQRDEETVLIP